MRDVSFNCARCGRRVLAYALGWRRSNGKIAIKDSEGRYVYSNRCPECRLLSQREERKENRNRRTKLYEKTKPGFLMRAYRNALSRVTGVNPTKNHIYLGKKIATKDDFYYWAITSKEFHRLFREWRAAGCPRKLSPTLSRKDKAKGYELDNLEWKTYSAMCIASNLGVYRRTKRGP